MPGWGQTGAGTKKGSPERQAKKDAKRAEKKAKEEFEQAVVNGVQTLCGDVGKLVTQRTNELIGIRTKSLRAARDEVLKRAQAAEQEATKHKQALDEKKIELRNEQATVKELRERLKAEQDARVADAEEFKETLAEKETTIRALNKTLRDTEKKLAPTDATGVVVNDGEQVVGKAGA